MSETDNATRTTTTCPCTNDLNSMKEHISVLNTEITAIRSFILEQIVLLIKSASQVSDTYPEQNSQYINVLLKQIYHIRQEKKSKRKVFMR